MNRNFLFLRKTWHRSVSRFLLCLIVCITFQVLQAQGQPTEKSLNFVNKLILSDESSRFEITKIHVSPAVIQSQGKIMIPVNDSFIGIFDGFTGKLVEQYLIKSHWPSQEFVSKYIGRNSDSFEMVSLYDLNNPYLNNRVPWTIESIFYFEEMEIGFIYCNQELAIYFEGVRGISLFSIGYFISFKLQENELIILNIYSDNNYDFRDQIIFDSFRKQFVLQARDTTDEFRFVPISYLNASPDSFLMELYTQYSIPTHFNLKPKNERTEDIYYHLKGSFAYWDKQVYFSNYSDIYKIGGTVSLAMEGSKYFDTANYYIYGFQMLSKDEIVIQLAGRFIDPNLHLKSKLLHLTFKDHRILKIIDTDIVFNRAYGLSKIFWLNCDVFLIVSEGESDIELYRYEYK